MSIGVLSMENSSLNDKKKLTLNHGEQISRGELMATAAEKNLYPVIICEPAKTLYIGWISEGRNYRKLPNYSLEGFFVDIQKTS